MNDDAKRAWLAGALQHITADARRSADTHLIPLALAEARGVQRLVFGTIDYALDLDLGDDPEALDHGHAH